MNNFHCLSQVYTFNNGNSIYISSRAIIRPDELESLNIKSVLSLGDENKLCSSERKALDRYLCLDLDDSDGDVARLSNVLPETRLFIYEALQSHSVLVHCRAGVCRSPVVVVDYLTRATDLSVQDALEHVKAKRDCVDPREEFLQVLTGAK